MKKFKKIKFNNKFGFTLIEILVVISLFLIIILIVSSFFTLSHASYNKGIGSAELVQNTRVGIDRISRELRQSVEIASVLPPSNSDPLNPPLNEIIFQDGHNYTDIVYIRYYLEGSDLKRDRLEYYFSVDPELKILRGSIDGFGDPPIESILESRVVGEYFKKLNFWKQNNQIFIDVELENGKNSFKALSSAYCRN